MPVQSKLSLRHPILQNNHPFHTFDKLPSPTASTTTHPQSTHLGKRQRAVSRTNGDVEPSKRQKQDVKEIGGPNRVAVRDHHVSDVFAKKVGGSGGRGLADDHATTSPRDASRVTSAVQPPSSGTIKANTVSQATSTNGDVPSSSSFEGNNNARGSSGGDSDKRALRSHDGGSRSKSELSLYFPNYEEFISNEPKELGESILSGAFVPSFEF